MMMPRRTIIFLAESFPHPIATFLAEHGYRLLEARSVAEVLGLYDRHPEVEALLVAPECEWYGLEHLRERRITMELRVHASAPDILFELSNILPNPPESLQ